MIVKTAALALLAGCLMQPAASLPAGFCMPLMQTMRTEKEPLLLPSSPKVMSLQGKETSTWKKGEHRMLAIDLSDENTSLAELLNSTDNADGAAWLAGLKAGLNNDAFTLKEDISLQLQSKMNEPLKIRAVFLDVVWNGDSKSLSLFLEGKEDLQAEEGKTWKKQFIIPVMACKDQSEDPDDSQPDPLPDPDPSADPDDGADSDDYSVISRTPAIYPQDDADDTGGEPEKPAPASATPYIIVERYTYGENSVQAGKTFDLTVFFKNTSKTLPVENIMMSLETDEGLSITSSSNTFYIESLAPQGTLSKTIQMKATGQSQSSSPSINISFRYEYVDDGTRQSQTTSERISIPVIEPDRFEVTVPQAPENAMAFEETVLSFPYVNKGKGTLSNVAVKVEGDIPCLSPVQNLGNFEAGKSGSIDVIVTPEEAKEYTFTVVVTYENASGDPVELKYPFTMMVSEPAPIFPDKPMPAPENPEQTSSMNWLLIALVVLAIFVPLGIFGWKKAKKKKKNKDETQQDEDTDWISALGQDDQESEKRS